MGVLKLIEAVALKNHIYDPVLEQLKETPEDLKTQETYNEAMRNDPCMLEDVPNCFKT